MIHMKCQTLFSQEIKEILKNIACESFAWCFKGQSEFKVSWCTLKGEKFKLKVTSLLKERIL